LCRKKCVFSLLGTRHQSVLVRPRPLRRACAAAQLRVVALARLVAANLLHICLRAARRAASARLRATGTPVQGAARRASQSISVYGTRHMMSAHSTASPAHSSTATAVAATLSRGSHSRDTARTAGLLALPMARPRRAANARARAHTQRSTAPTACVTRKRVVAGVGGWVWGGRK
jgi:hypothetical protein